MLAQHLAVIAGINHKRIVEQPGSFQLVKQIADIRVQLGDHPEVSGPCAAYPGFRDRRRNQLEIGQSLEHNVALLQVTGRDIGQRHVFRPVSFSIFWQCDEARMGKREAHVSSPRVLLPGRLVAQKIQSVFHVRIVGMYALLKPSIDLPPLVDAKT